MTSDSLIPLIVITADVRPTDGHLRHGAVESYLSAVVTGVGGIPLIAVGAKKVPNKPETTARITPWASPRTAGVGLRIDM